MREIKFRAWDRKKKKMIYPKSFDESIVIQLGGVIGRFDFKRKVYNTATDEIVLMQYTGLKDKHGKEIYEGDIVRFKAERPRYSYIVERTGIVEYFEEQARFTITVLIGNNTYEDYPFWEAGDIEVIGNIYENPELLEVSP